MPLNSSGRARAADLAPPTALKAAIASYRCEYLQLCPDSAHRAVQSGALDLLWAPDGGLDLLWAPDGGLTHCDLSNGSVNLVDRLLFLALTRVPPIPRKPPSFDASAT